VWVFKKEAPEKPKASCALENDSESGVSLLQQDHDHKKQDAQQTPNSSSEALSANGVSGVSGGVSDDDIGVREAYSQLLRVLKLPAMSKLCMILLSCKVAFAVTDAATTLKFVEYGVPKEQLAYFAPAFVG
jgi:hypothetical protein